MTLKESAELEELALLEPVSLWARLLAAGVVSTEHDRMTKSPRLIHISFLNFVGIIASSTDPSPSSTYSITYRAHAGQLSTIQRANTSTSKIFVPREEFTRAKASPSSGRGKPFKYSSVTDFRYWDFRPDPDILIFDFVSNPSVCTLVLNECSEIHQLVDSEHDYRDSMLDYLAASSLRPKGVLLLYHYDPLPEAE